MSPVDRLKSALAGARERSRLLDHVLAMQEHYSEVKASQQAGGVTYFGFLSVFPVLALAFFSVGYVAEVYPDARDTLVTAIDEILPGLVGDGAGEISLQTIQDAAGAVGLIGLAGVLYAGLGWLSSLRTALSVVFELPERLQPNFVIGKLRDLLALAVLGLVLMVSVAASGVLTRTSRQVLDALGIEAGVEWAITLLALLLGLAASTVLFNLLFRLLAQPPLSARALWSGALLGAVGFEVLKQLSSVLLTGTEGKPAFQAFGIALILLVWINYFSRVVLYAAAWAHTDHAARAERTRRRADEQDPDPVGVPAPAGATALATGVAATGVSTVPTAPTVPLAVAAGVGAILGALVARARRR